DDPILFVKWLPVQFFTKGFVRKYIKIILLIYTLMHSTANIWDVAEGRATDRFYTKTLFLACCQVFVTIMVVESFASHMKYTEKIMKEQFWAVDAVSTTRNIKIIKGVMFFGAVDALVFIGNCVVNSFYPDWPFVSKENGSWQFIVHGAMFVVFAATSYCVVYMHWCYVFYYCYHVWMQTALLGEYFKNISSDLDLTSSPELHQKIVHERILFGVEKHIKLISYTQSFQSSFAGKRMGIPLINAMAILSLSLYWGYKESLPSMLFFVANFSGLILSFLVAGEVYSSGFEAFVNSLCMCDWYNWGETNKKLYLIFLVFVQRFPTMKIFPPLEARHTAALWIFRGLYSVAAVMNSMYKRE
ncbi:Odorant receptor Or91, partial [Rhyzopertha dominica]